MRLLAPWVACSLALMASGAAAAPYKSSLSKCCAHSATDRACWGDYDLSTNYYDEVPNTGVTVEVYLELVNTTASLDGVERQVLLVNGTFPGPTIIADWGDTVVVHLYNGLTNNGTGLHFHGIRQNYTNQMDGVPSITQCPVAPGESITYTWRATQYGSTWYHSHFALQTWEGIFGGIIINGPATSNYDEDLGVLFLNDWTHQTADQLFITAETATAPPTLDNGLINGTNVFGNLGSRFESQFTAGESYRIRLVNAAIDTMFKFMIDNHTMTVIAADLVPIVPYTTDHISIGIGQRYDIIVNASESSGDYWMRAIPQESCSNNAGAENIKGIIRYDPSSTSDPTTSAYAFTDSCDDEFISNLVPYLSMKVGPNTLEDDFAVTAGPSNGVFRWYMAGITFVAEMDNPTVLQIYNHNTNFTNSSHVISLDAANEWVYFIIETPIPVSHPIHLHGHDFYILAQGTGPYSNSTTLSLTNPPRRDVAMLPGSGHLVIGFPADNPGAWLMHCHIGWHTAEGLALQLVERYDDIAALMDYDTMNSTCVAWDAYVLANGTFQGGSGV